MAKTRPAEFSFEEFANEPFYVEVNRRLAELSGKIVPAGAETKTIADLACGNGLMTKLAYGLFTPSDVLLLDRDADGLEAARYALQSYSGQTSFSAVQADLEQPLPLKDSSIDAVLLTNAIHMVHDKDGLVGEVARITRPGGYFLLNTTFFDGAYVDGTEKLWFSWTYCARRIIKEQGLAYETDKQKSESMRQLSQEGYLALLTSNGFLIAAVSLDKTSLDRSALEAIAGYGEFADGAMRVRTDDGNAGLYLSNASSALKSAVPRLFEDKQIDSIERNWLQVVAVRE